MSIINYQPRPKIPPIGFFQPISTDPKDMMTDVEFLLGVLKKLNEVIKQVNSNSEFIENYSGRIEEIESAIETLKTEMADFETEINDEIQSRFSAIETQLASMIATALIQANAYTDSVASNLEQMIREISIGQITVYDPTTGSLNSLQNVIDNIYGTSREEALTAGEYDALELTANAYDEKQLTAFEYDRYGKTLLMV